MNETPINSQPDKSRKGRPRILFVCFADSTHSQSWISLLDNSEFDVRVFASNVASSDYYPPLVWNFPTYCTVRPDRRQGSEKVFSLLPNRPAPLLYASRWLERKFYLTARYLRWIILRWQPDIVHSLRLYPEAWLTHQVLQYVLQNRRPRWIVSTWGSDLNVFSDQPPHQDQVKPILENCDGFFADCRRDLNKAISLGLSESKLALPDPVPGTGGLQPDDFLDARLSHSNRNLIVVPKAYDAPFHKTAVILEALRMVENALDDYEVHLLMCSDEVRMWLSRMPQKIRSRLHAHQTIPHDEFLKMLKRTRVVIAPSLSDGTPNVMLEAMASGALPLMSPIDSIEEWIADGQNGLLAPALRADLIAEALLRALRDDELFERAQRINWDLVSRRANRDSISQQVADYYQRVADNAKTFSS
jgi:glycosyltransferase involved in cell wall biosynthesis